MAWRTIIFAPDAEGQLVEVPDKGLPPLGTQTTLPVQEAQPILYDHRERPIYEPRPSKAIGFRPR